MKILTALAVGFGVIASPVAAVTTTFATFSAISSTPSVEYNGSGNGAGAVTSVNQPVTFRLLDPNGGPTFTDFAATFNLVANTSSGIVAGGIGIAPVTSGTFSFISATPVTFAGSTGTNLLSGTFSGGAFTALIGGSTANYGNSTPPNMVNFTSSFLDFTSSTERGMAFAITGINPLIAAASLGNGPANFAGTIVGSFSADVFAGNELPVVPEPATWALMIGGFGMVGGAMRRRNALPTVTA